jgi:hypothetical protein
MKLIHSDHVFAVERCLKGKVTLVDLQKPFVPVKCHLLNDVIQVN